MKVILLSDIPKVGKKYEVKDFKEGYAQNVLLSKGLAELATPHALLKLDQMKIKMTKEKEVQEESFKKLISDLQSMEIRIKVKANEKGILFKAINAGDIAKAVKESSGLVVDESIFITPHIKELGSHAVVLRKGEAEGKTTVIVEK